MSIVYCEECDKHIDTDYNAEHFMKDMLLADKPRRRQLVADAKECEECGMVGTHHNSCVKCE